MRRIVADDADGLSGRMRARRPDSPLQLVLRLGRSLADAGVPYCHWKSNAAIDRSLSGENDLDLLVGRSAVEQFRELLLGLGFTRAYKPGVTIPGIESFYGLDRDTDCFVHVHAHYELVLGDDRTKNYRIPIEDSYIASARPSGGLMVPAPEFEYVVFVIRMVLKYCTWDEIVWSALRGRRAGPRSSERLELTYLRDRTDGDRVSSIVSEHVPALAGGLFADCVAAVAGDLPTAERVRTGRRLEIALQSNARMSRDVDCALRVGRRLAVAVDRRTRPARRSRLADGGAMIGIMGGDGAGKSTALGALESWLGREFDVRIVHLGKPTWSATTITVRGALKVATMATGALQRHVRAEPIDRLADLLVEYRPLFWLLCTARDRRNTYRSARKFAAGGGLVLCDRYPHARLNSMEVPLIRSQAGTRADDRVVQAMIVLEERYHRAIAPPELLVVLRVDPEVAVARKVDEAPESVRRRSTEIWNVDWHGAGVHVVDASRPPDNVADELKELVWSAIG